MDKTARNINHATIAVAVVLILAYSWLYMREQFTWAIVFCVLLIAIDLYYNATH